MNFYGIIPIFFLSLFLFLRCSFFRFTINCGFTLRKNNNYTNLSDNYIELDKNSYLCVLKEQKIHNH
jgi:hypothetical protein